MLDAESKGASPAKQEDDPDNIIEMLYAKAEECSGDVTGLCGPKSKPGMKKFAGASR